MEQTDGCQTMDLCLPLDAASVLGKYALHSSQIKYKPKMQLFMLSAVSVI